MYARQHQYHACPALSPVRGRWSAFPLAPALRSTDSVAVTESGCALFAGFPATMTGLDFPRPYIIGYSSSLSRHRPPASSAGGQTWDLPASDAIRLHVIKHGIVFVAPLEHADAPHAV